MAFRDTIDIDSVTKVAQFAGTTDLDQRLAESTWNLLSPEADDDVGNL